VQLPAREYQLVYVYSASVHVPYLNANLRTLAEVEHDSIAQSILQPNSSYYVIPETSAIDGLPKAPYVTGAGKETQLKYELLHSGFVAHWQLVRVVNRLDRVTYTNTLRYKCKMSFSLDLRLLILAL
jgi:hypothetical protein